MRLKLTVVLLFVIIRVSMFAENEEPSSVDLMIPPVIVEIEHSDPHDLPINIPYYNNLGLPELGIVLPDPADITIKELPADIPLPSLDTPKQQKAAAFFSEGNLGVGIHNQLIGDIRLFKLGTGPRFSILFSHEGLDGYGIRNAGEGFFNRKELFEGTLYGESENIAYKGEGSLSEIENGLQQQSSIYSSVVHRFRSGSFILDKQGEVWAWHIGTNIRSAERVLSGSTPYSNSFLAVSPEISLKYSKESFSFSMGSSYQMEYQRENLFHLVTAGINTNYHFPSLDLGGRIEGSFIPGAGFHYPFSLFLSGSLVKKIQFQTEGGYRSVFPDHYTLWSILPFAESAEGISYEWFWEGNIRTILFPGFSVFTSWNWENTDNFFSLTDSSLPDPETGLFVFESIGSYDNLTLSGGADLTLNEKASVSAEWKGQFLRYHNPVYPLHQLSAVLKYKLPDDSFGSTLTFGWALDPFEILPELGGNVFFKLSSGVSLFIETTDILPLIFNTDRTFIGPYIKSSGMLTMKVKISL